MYLKIVEVSFIILSLILSIQMTTLYCGITKRMRPLSSSAYVSFVAVVLLLYILNALALTFVFSGISKYIMIFLALVPFVIGLISRYRTYKICTVIQNFIIICGIIYVGHIV